MIHGAKEVMLAALAELRSMPGCPAGGLRPAPHRPGVRCCQWLTGSQQMAEQGR